MIEIRPSSHAEILRQRELWQLAFGDENEYIDLYYQHAFSPEDVLVLLDDGQIQSMVICLPAKLQLSQFGQVNAAYFYALATDPAARGKGHARRLLAFAHDFLAASGVQAGVTVPAMPSLFSFFQGAGLDPFFYFGEHHFTRADTAPVQGTLQSCPWDEYSAARKSILGERLALHYPDAQIRWQKAVCRLAGTDLYRIQTGGDTAFCVVEREGERLVAKELLTTNPAGLAAAASVLLGELGASSITLRTPLCMGGQKTRFGSIKFYDAALAERFAQQSGYLGLAFD